MKIFFSEYELQGKSFLNSASDKKSVRGYLLKYVFDSGVGYASLTAWPELGDLALDAQMAFLQRGEETPLSRQTLACAQADAEFRAKGEGALAGVKIPESHFLLTDLELEEEVVSAFMQGFHTIKVKIGRKWHEEIYQLEKLAERFPVLRWRLDANASLSFAEVISLWGGASLHLRRRIEYIEDPCKYRASDWKRLSEKFPVALDFEFSSWLSDPIDLAYLVIKPEAQDAVSLVETYGSRFSNYVVTSYMGHPIGQAWSAFQASKLAESGKLALCGLRSDLAFEPNDYSKQLFVSGTGIGFDSLLEQTDWRPL